MRVAAFLTGPRLSGKTTSCPIIQGHLSRVGVKSVHVMEGKLGHGSLQNGVALYDGFVQNRREAEDVVRVFGGMTGWVTVFFRLVVPDDILLERLHAKKTGVVISDNELRIVNGVYEAEAVSIARYMSQHVDHHHEVVVTRDHKPEDVGKEMYSHINGVMNSRAMHVALA